MNNSAEASKPVEVVFEISPSMLKPSFESYVESSDDGDFRGHAVFFQDRRETNYLTRIAPTFGNSFRFDGHDGTHCWFVLFSQCWWDDANICRTPDHVSYSWLVLSDEDQWRLTFELGPIFAEVDDED